MQWKYNLVKPYLHGSLLDYGCGTGSFIKYCNKKGISVTGVEPSDARNSITDIPVYKALDNLNEQQFSVITLWHVLEHVYQLREILQILKEKLTQNGTIFIAVPNRESLDAKTYREFWAAWDVPRHIWHFSPDNMKALISQEGMQIREIIPMKLDAYYVSLLSEKYKRGGKHTVRGLIGALKTAIQSNFTASKNGQYSSLIYRISR